MAAVEQTLREQADEIARLKAAKPEPSRPSTPALSEAETRELVKLRAQYAPLKEAARETEKLREKVAAASQPPPPPRPEGPDYWPKTSLAFAGHATADATLKSMLWALQTNDMKSVLGCLDPKVATGIEGSLIVDGQPTEESQKQFHQMAEAFTGPTSAYHIVGRETLPDGGAIIDVAFEGQASTVAFTLKMVGPEWRIFDIGQPKTDE